MNGDTKPLKTRISASDIVLPWCSGCGIGIVFSNMLAALEDLRYDPESVCIFTGIGCTGDIPKYTTTRSRQIIDGTLFSSVCFWKAQNPSTKVIVIMNDVDLFLKDASNITAIVRSGMDVLIIYVNNFVYQTIAYGKGLVNTPFNGIKIENQVSGPENMPHLLDLSGASYIARWTALHVRRFLYSLRDALKLKGSSFIEIVSPCLMYFSHHGDLGKVVDRMDMLKQMTEIKNNEPTQNVAIRPSTKIIIGKFVDRTADSQSLK